MNKWYRFADWVAANGRVVTIYRLSLGMALGLALVLAYPDQAIEALLVLGEDAALGQWVPLAAFFVTLVMVSLCLWFWARALGIRFCCDQLERHIDGHTAAVHLPRLCGVLPPLGAAVGFWMARRLNTGAVLPIAKAERLASLGGSEPGSGVLWWMTLLATLLAGALYLAFVLRRVLLNRMHARTSAAAPPAFGAEITRATKVVLIGGLLLALTLLLVFSSQPLWAIAIGPMAVVCLAAAVWATLGSGLVWLGHRFRFPPLTLLTLWVVSLSLFSCNDNHTIRQTKNVRAGLPQEFGAAFQEWLKNRPDRADYETYPVFLVSAEGGGIYAAYFTAMLLSALQDADPRFAQHVFAISGVSGGSVGATCFVAGRSLADVQAESSADSPTSIPELPKTTAATSLSRTCLKRDLLSPLLAMMLFPDLAQRLWPWPIQGFDRALGLELGFEAGWKEASGQDLPDDFFALWKDFPRGTAPALFLNTTDVGLGRRMVVTNLYPLDERFNYMYTFADIDHTATLPVSTAACLSARFPYVTPVGTIPTGADAKGRPVRHPRFADGGYFDNAGTVTLSEILAALRTSESRNSGVQEFQPIILRIGTPQQDREKPGSESDRLKFTSRGLGESLSPVRALLNTRGARSDIAVHQLHSVVTGLQDRGIAADIIDFELETEVARIPLGWLLSERSRREIERQIGKPRVATSTMGVENDANMGAALRALRPVQ